MTATKSEDRPLTIMLVAAEASGDALGAGLARALKARLGDRVRFVGVGGPKMAAEGVDSPFDITELSILGWIEGIRAYGRVKRRVAETAALAERERPDGGVLIDSWGFTGGGVGRRSYGFLQRGPGRVPGATWSDAGSAAAAGAARQPAQRDRAHDARL